MAPRLVLSRHVSLLPLDGGLILCGHAFRGPLNVVDREQRAHLEAFREPRDLDDFLRQRDGADREQLAALVRVWQRQGLLVDAHDDEDARIADEFGPEVETVRAGVTRARMRSRHDPRWRFRLAPTPAVGAPVASWRVAYLGGCLLLPSLDALLELAAERGYDLHGAGSFASDHALLDEQQPDFVVIGDLPRVGLGWNDARPVQYAAALRASIHAIRAHTAAPILVRNLIVPTCSLGGLADRGAASHINKVRAENLAIAELAELPGVYVVDIDQTLALAGKRGLVDDAVVLSHHLASLTWLVERAERGPIPGLDAAALLRAAAEPRDRLELEYLLAAEDLRVMCAIRGAGRRKVVVVDLDDTLWPGVLAETGAPFPADLAVDVYPHHLYLGLHEALLALRARGILLACISKNDEAVVRALWRYPAALAGAPALTLADFATYRIDWNDKADNLLSIADELGLPLDTFAFVDDSARERDLVRARCPGVMILGDNPFAVRWQLLTDAAFQIPHITDEARRRSDTVRGQLAREQHRAAADPAAFRASLDLRCTLRRELDDRNLARITELVHRTTQLNTTGEQPTPAELRACTLYTLDAADRFADYGLVGACLVDSATIRQLVLSCRVLGLGLEELLLRAAARDIAHRSRAARITGRLLATSRNHPAQRLFARCGFERDAADPSLWSITTASLADIDLPYTVTCDGIM